MFTFDRRAARRVAAVCIVICGASVAVAPAAKKAQRRSFPVTTSYGTIVGADPSAVYSRLRFGPGDKRVVRTELAAPRKARHKRRRSVLYFGQMSDFQLADEESPARVEALDYGGTPFTSAWRPQEALGPQTVDQGIRQLNRFAVSPIRNRRTRHARMALLLTTGDNADNQQANEVAWTVRLMEGGRLDPNSGVERAGCGPTGESARYTGVQDADDTLESGQFYDPDAPVGAFAAWPRWPGLLDRAQRPFDAPGLTVPSYVAFGNHDGLVQGNAWANAVFEGLVTSCVKPLTSGALGGPSFLTTAPDRTVVVPPDPARSFVDRKGYMALHRTGVQGDAHGFGLVDPAETAASAGQASYYAFSPRPGIRLVSINTVAEGEIVGSEGNLDDPQFRWLERTLDAAQKAKELVILFGHHPIRTMTQVNADEEATPCDASRTTGPGCDGDPRDSRPIHLGGDLQQLLIDRPSVIAYVAGHTHEHRITPFKRDDARGGGFWGIETASHVDWPIQSRLLEVMDNRDGTLSIFGTVVDHGGRIDTPAPGAPADGFTEEQLAAVARELSYNDPQAGGKNQAGGGSGKTKDRNVELVLPDPRR